MNEKEKKYDRQLRLWGNHGQQALEKSCICLLNVTATGTEILKNLILPGIGGFVIVDNQVICGEDAGTNFFLDPACIGTSKSKVAAKLLMELNPDVKGEYVEEDPGSLLENNPAFFLKFSVVVACNVTEEVLLKLDRYLWDHRIPLVVATSLGLLGYLRLVFQEQCIIESHPDNAHEDFRLDQPFSELTEHIDSVDLDSMDKKDHSHTPYLVILFKFLQKWKADHAGAAPKTYTEKKQFKEFVLSGRRKNEDGIFEQEENFEEAARQVNSALVPTKVPAHVTAIFDNAKCKTVSEGGGSFWLLAQALRRFVERRGVLPLRGSLPDMVSDSDGYVKLQNVYQARARCDMHQVMEHVAQILVELGCGNGKISEAEIKRFCRNSHFLRVVGTKSIREEYDSPSDEVLAAFKESDTDSDVLWYVMLRATERFRTLNGRFPGSRSDEVETDIGRLKTCLTELTNEWGIPGAVEAISDDYCHEVARWGGAELHAIAALTGGVAAHEIVKLVTCQFVPLHGAFVYNAVKSTSLSFAV